MRFVSALPCRTMALRYGLKIDNFCDLIEKFTKYDPFVRLPAPVLKLVINV